MMILPLLLAASSVPLSGAVFRLWQGDAPGANGNAPKDIPDITVYIPEGAKNCPAVVICPGGGYSGLCSSYEGHDIARWLNSFGIAGIVLKYRVTPYHHPAQWNDASRAMRFTRLHAAEWKIDPSRIGIMGFSAGGHLASVVAVHNDKGKPQSDDPVERMSSRPDFAVLIYPVIDLEENFHFGSRVNLLGENPSAEVIRFLSTNRQVTKDVPPTFVAHSRVDEIVPVENSRSFVAAMKAQGRPVEYFELLTGKHGLGCGKSEEWESWQRECHKWFVKNGLCEK